MRGFLKKIDWVYCTILTASLVTAYFVTGTVTAEIPELPMWYSQSASVGMAVGMMAVLILLRVLGEATYQIVRNAMAMGRRIP
jgi:hypothetical protein